MEKKKEYLNEENYERGKNKLKTISLIILLVGILIGGSLIAIGLMKQVKINSEYSEENKVTISQRLETEKQSLISKKSELETKIEPIETQIKKLEREPFTGFDDAYYERKDKIEELEKNIATDKKSINVIDDVLENADFACKFDGKTNSYTSKYCSLSIQLSDINDDFNKGFHSFGSIPFYIFGVFVIIASCMISFSIFMLVKRREILAFSAQQIMPIAQEGIEKMAPTIGKARASIAKEMAPVYGDIAKGISKGIKEGINEANDKK